MIYWANGPPKQPGVAILISDKEDFKPKLVRRDKEGHIILIKGAIHEEDIAIVNVYAPNINAHNQPYATGLKNTDRPQHSDSSRLEYSSVTNR
jgi:hypothetical protein